jgi:hypothetical protein
VSCYGTGRAMDQAADTFSSEPDAMSRRCAAPEYVKGFETKGF